MTVWIVEQDDVIHGGTFIVFVAATEKRAREWMDNGKRAGVPDMYVVKEWRVYG